MAAVLKEENRLLILQGETLKRLRLDEKLKGYAAIVGRVKHQVIRANEKKTFGIDLSRRSKCTTTDRRQRK